MSRQFDAMAQGCGRFRRLIDCRRALPFPLPASMAVECFRENMLSFGIDIDAHLARPSGAITPVHGKIGINDAQVGLLTECTASIACRPPIALVLRSITSSTVFGARSQLARTRAIGNRPENSTTPLLSFFN